MAIELIEPPTSYRPDYPPETRYQRARQEWDERIGSAVVQAANWRHAFFASALILVFLCSANLYQVFVRKVVPFVITVNGQTGEPRVIGPAGMADYTPQAAETRYFLTQFIRYVRSLPADPVVVRQNWLTAYQFLTPEAANILNAKANGEEGTPLKMLGEKTVTVQPTSVNQIGQSSSYQLRWAEEVFDKRGSRIESYSMTGIFVVEIQAPKDESVLNINPLGIFIKDFQWSREL